MAEVFDRGTSRGARSGSIFAIVLIIALLVLVAIWALD